MIIHTSYLAKTKAVQEANFTPVSIVRYPQRWMTMRNISLLSPDSKLLARYKHDGDSDMFSEGFAQQLGELDLDQTMNLLKGALLSGTNGIALMCYERADDFCHRHITLDWLSSHPEIIAGSELEFS